jgi:hypothetical protein
LICSSNSGEMIRSSSFRSSGATSTRGTTSSRAGSPGCAGGRQRARATAGAPSRVSRSTSSAVTARRRAAQVQRAANLRVLDALRVDAAGGRVQVRHRRHERDRRVQNRQPVRRDVAAPPAAEAVAGHVDLRVDVRDRAVLAHPALPVEHPRPEADLAGRARPGEDLVVVLGVGEVGDLGPLLLLGLAGALVAGQHDPHRLVEPARQHGHPAHLEHLPGPAVAGAEQLGRGRLGVVRGDRAAEGDADSCSRIGGFV